MTLGLVVHAPKSWAGVDFGVSDSCNRLLQTYANEVAALNRSRLHKFEIIASATEGRYRTAMIGALESVEAIDAFARLLARPHPGQTLMGSFYEVLDGRISVETKDGRHYSITKTVDPDETLGFRLVSEPGANMSVAGVAARLEYVGPGLEETRYWGSHGNPFRLADRLRTGAFDFAALTVALDVAGSLGGRRPSEGLRRFKNGAQAVDVLYDDFLQNYFRILPLSDLTDKFRALRARVEALGPVRVGFAQDEVAVTATAPPTGLRAETSDEAPRDWLRLTDRDGNSQFVGVPRAQSLEALELVAASGVAAPARLQISVSGFSLKADGPTTAWAPVNNKLVQALLVIFMQVGI